MEKPNFKSGLIPADAFRQPGLPFFIESNLKLMKHYFAAAAAACLAVLAAGPAQAQQSASVKLLQPLIEHQCVSELKDSKVWTASTFLMTEANKNQFQKEVCSCVGENVLNDVGVKDLAHAAVSEEAKRQLVRKAAMNSIKGCVLQSKR